jgi:hypothetical protein
MDKIEIPKIEKPKPVMRLNLPPLHPAQYEVVNAFDKYPGTRFVVCTAGSKWGKSFGLSIKMVQEAWSCTGGELFFWVAPTYAQTRIAYNLIKRLLPKKSFNEQKSEMLLTLLDAYGEDRAYIQFKSAEDGDRLRGYGTTMFVLDEAARCSQDSFESLVTNTTQTRGKGIIISTPKGRGWFYETYKRGDKSLLVPGEVDPNPEWRSFRCAVKQNPYVKKETLDELKRLFSESMYRQEVEAEFLSDRDGVFGDIHSCISGELEEPEYGHIYVVGCDLAQLHDYTVMVVMDYERNHVVGFYRFNKMSWEAIYQQIAAVTRKYNNAKLVIDATTYGSAPVETLARHYNIDVLPFKITSNELKSELIEKLKISIERKEISYPNIPVLIQELSDYEYKISGRGTTIYSAPRGKFDDTVLATSLANWYCMAPRYMYKYYNVRGV